MDIISELKRKKNFISKNSVMDKDIEKAEKDLKLKFSKEYYNYLKVFGRVIIYGHEFTGLDKNISTNVVNVTKDIREIDQKFPDNFYVIEETHFDGILICQDESGKVYKFLPQKGSTKIFDSFFEYINEL